MKKLLALCAAIFTLTVSACDYPFSYTLDYIGKINNMTVTEVTYNDSDSSNIMTVHNNLIVDFPLTVSVSLFSNTEHFYLPTYGVYGYIGYIYDTCKLQYRVLPNGKWVTVSNYIPHDINGYTGAYKNDYNTPKNYFGRNTINIKNLAAGTAIMIRLYTQNEYATSGDELDLCTGKLTTVSTDYGTVQTLPSTYTYTIDQDDISTGTDLGGGWKPHSCVTVIYSGNERVIR